MDPSLTCGTHVQQLIRQQLERLRTVQPEVLADRDPEPLHQFRVSLRRLRSVVGQFGPALVLPPRLQRSKIAQVARATGNCRDADVLREWLEQQLLPRLDQDAHESCKPLLRQLRRQRRLAFEELKSVLSSGRYLKLLDDLEHWCASPRTTPLGDLKLQDWLQEWLMPLTGSYLLLHTGWFATDPAAPELHELRKRVKEARYGVEALRPWLGVEGEEWIDAFKRVQACLGDLHDQDVLLQLIRELEQDRDNSPPRALLDALGEERAERWRQWQELTGSLLQPQRRQDLVRLGASPPLRKSEPS